MSDHDVVNRDDWMAARRALLVDEKQYTKESDRMSSKRQSLPWLKVTESYVFDTVRGEERLLDLFAGRSQLVVYHFMFAPEWDAGCPHCSFWADSYQGATAHLAQRDVTFTLASRAPLEKLQAYKSRMGWEMDWVSSGRSTFNFDFGVSFTEAQQAVGADYNFKHEDHPASDREGLSVFAREGDDVFLTYCTFARGIDQLNVAYAIMDLVPKGRDEGGQSQFWVKRHDEYT